MIFWVQGCKLLIVFEKDYLNLVYRSTKNMIRPRFMSIYVRDKIKHNFK